MTLSSTTAWTALSFTLPFDHFFFLAALELDDTATFAFGLKEKYQNWDGVNIHARSSNPSPTASLILPLHFKSDPWEILHLPGIELTLKGHSPSRYDASMSWTGRMVLVLVWNSAIVVDSQIRLNYVL